jgi:hypothetical protein
MSLSLDQDGCDYLFLLFCRHPQQGHRRSGGDFKHTAGPPKLCVMRETLLACPERENDNDDPVKGLLGIGLMST